MKLFAEKLLRETFVNKISQLKWEIKNLKCQNPENIDIQELSEKFFGDFKIEHISILLENRNVDVSMVGIDANQFPQQYDVETGKRLMCKSKIQFFSP